MELLLLANNSFPDRPTVYKFGYKFGIKHGSGKSVEIHYKFDHLPSGNLT